MMTKLKLGGVWAIAVSQEEHAKAKLALIPYDTYVIVGAW